MDTQQIRRMNLRRLVAEHEGMNSLARALGLTKGAYISQLLTEPPVRTVSEKTARAWEKKLGLPEGWMDGAAQSTPAATTIDSTILAQVLTEVSEALRSARVALTPAQTAELVAMQYSDAHAAGRVDVSRVKAIVGLLRR